MAESLTVYVNGRSVVVPVGSTAAVAVLLANATCRISVSGEPRGPLCGMGTCFECRVEVNGQGQRRSCQVLCEPNMDIKCHG